MASYWLNFFNFYGGVLRRSLYNIKFSVGDVYLIVLAALLIFLLVSAWKSIQLRRLKGPVYLLIFGISLMLQFYMTWGLNYSYRSFTCERHLALDSNKIRLNLFCEVLVRRCKEERGVTADHVPSKMEGMQIRKHAGAEFSRLQTLLGIHSCDAAVKPSLLDPVALAMGVAGYTNPFTLEAQVCSIPSSEFAFTCFHELAHQAGYAYETEANIIAYLVCTNSKYATFRYSALLQALEAALNLLRKMDKARAHKIVEKIPQAVLTDIVFERRFAAKNNGWMSYWSGKIYSHYLQSNHQPTGLNEYDRFIYYLSGMQQAH